MDLYECSQPWFELQICYDGKTSSCCYYNGSKHQIDFSRGFELDELWNGPEIKKLRSIIASGQEAGTGCDGCKWLHYSKVPQFINDIGHTASSNPNTEARVYSNWQRAIENYNNRAIEIDSYPVKYYFDFGLTCNIRCKMCCQTHTRAVDRRILPVEPLIKMRPYLTIADQIHIIGGEPLVIPEAQRFIEHMLSEPSYSQTMLSLYTNGTLLHQYLDRFQALRRINVCVSLDSVGKAYEEIRLGANWLSTERNILEFKSLGAKLGLDWQATVACVVMKSSIMHLERFVEWCISNDIQCHFVPLDFVDTAIDEDVFRFPLLLDQIPGWSDIFDRSIELLQKKGWVTGRAETLKAIKNELKELHGAQKSKETIENMITLAMSKGADISSTLKGYITKAQTLAELGHYDRLEDFCSQVIKEVGEREMRNNNSSGLSLASAYWNQRKVLSAHRERFRTLSDAVDHKSDLNLYQWAQIAAMSLEFKPDLILELGRGKGNSTCLFTETANMMGGSRFCNVTSLCINLDFPNEVLPRLFERRLIDRQWLSPLDCWYTDILAFDFEALLADKKRILVFWDAHGFEVANCVLGRILPQIYSKQHIVLMHDMSDHRYMGAEILEYKTETIWRGNNWEGPRVIIGNISSAVEQAISITDFSLRNGFEPTSADHSNHTELKPYPEKMQEMQQLLGDEFFQLQGHWFYFSLNDHKRPFTFPKFRPPEKFLVDEKIELLSRFGIK